MKWKELFVDRETLRPNGLNLTPGENAGITFAAKYGLNADNPEFWERNEQVARQIQANAKNRGSPNVAMSLGRLNSPDLIRRLVISRANTFDGNDIAMIRSMTAHGIDWKEIARRLEVHDARRVRQVIEGQTYTFFG